MDSFLQILLYLPSGAILMLLPFLFLLVVLCGLLIVQHRRLNDCHYVIVRLMGEKEEMKKLLPTGLSARFYPTKMTKVELLCLIKVINRLLIQTPDEAVYFRDTYISPQNGGKETQDTPVSSPNTPV